MLSELIAKVKEMIESVKQAVIDFIQSIKNIFGA